MFPKPEPRRVTKARQRRQEAEAWSRVRLAVWIREGGRCVACGVPVAYPGKEAFGRPYGHVHHLRGRNVAPEDKLNPEACVLVCEVCHDHHHRGIRRIDHETRTQRA